MSETPNVLTDMMRLQGGPSYTRRAVVVGFGALIASSAVRSLFTKPEEKKMLDAGEVNPAEEEGGVPDDLQAALKSLPPCSLQDFQNGVQVGPYFVQLENAPVIDEISVNDKTLRLVGARGLASGAALSFKNVQWVPGVDGKPGTLKICVCAKKYMMPVKQYLNIPEERVDDLILDLQKEESVSFKDDEGDDTGADLIPVSR